MSFMLDEIRQQPDIVRTIVDDRRAVEDVAREIARREPRTIHVVARGTSDHAANYAKYLFEIGHGIPTMLAAASPLTVYGRGLTIDPRTLVIGISQSGAGPDVTAVVEHARKSGATTLALTNTR